jgi:hypothetical protein
VEKKIFTSNKRIAKAKKTNIYYLDETWVNSAAAEFLPAVRNSQVLQQVVNGKGLALVIRMIGLSDESIIFIIDVGKNF